MRNDEQVRFLSVGELLNGRKNKYIIPMYQRNYAWGETEIAQLIQDVMDCCLGDGRDYHIGTLVAYEHAHSAPHTPAQFDVIDGQQRLTTLCLLALHLTNSKRAGNFQFEEFPISFESRETSDNTLAYIRDGKLEEDMPAAQLPAELNVEILHGYRLIQTLLPQKLKENGSDLQEAEFARYLFEKVLVLRAKLPEGTDLNQYFEIMNNRGEQLEKHEILKASMLAKLEASSDAEDKAQSRHCLHLAWEACANMETYVQMEFGTKEREVIFDGASGKLIPCSFEELKGKLWEQRQNEKPLKGVPSEELSRAELTFEDILCSEALNIQHRLEDAPDKSWPDRPDRFSPIINFPNFLLHVLRVFTDNPDVPLDDKHLIKAFKRHLLDAEDAAQKVRGFILTLLRCKLLFDRYVLKREFADNESEWSLQSLKGNGASYANTFGQGEADTATQDRILMLQAAFHVSASGMTHKHWLSGALRHLYLQAHDGGGPGVAATSYLRYLESLAEAFVFDRFLTPEKPTEYDTIIWRHHGQRRQKKADCPDAHHINDRLTYGNNLVFVLNYLDYLIWMRHIYAGGTDPKIKYFKFTFRSSVEHLYPRTPFPGQLSLNKTVLDSFGNLCLISHGSNSRLSNFTPSAKKELRGNAAFESLKQYKMLHSDDWNKQASSEEPGQKLKLAEEAIISHSREMKQLLLDGPLPEP